MSTLSPLPTVTSVEAIEEDWSLSVVCEQTEECDHEATWRRQMWHTGEGKLCATRLVCDTCRARAIHNSTTPPGLVCKYHQLDIHFTWSPLT